MLLAIFIYYLVECCGVLYIRIPVLCFNFKVDDIRELYISMTVNIGFANHTTCTFFEAESVSCMLSYSCHMFLPIFLNSMKNIL